MLLHRIHAPQARTESYKMNAYELKIQAKRERFEALAVSNAAASNAAHTQAMKMASVIPFGQPILVGHHSEKSDRGYRSKIHNTFGKSAALDEKASHYAQKAASVGTGGISSDDPEAVQKLQSEVDALELLQTRMKAVNKAIKQGKTPEAQTAALVALGYCETDAVHLITPRFGNIGYPSYRLTNNNANIRTKKARIAELQARAQLVDKVEDCEGYTYREDTEDNRVCFEFEGKPADNIRDILKSNGFKWSPTRGAWIRQLNANGIWAAKQVKELLKTA